MQRGREGGESTVARGSKGEEGWDAHACSLDEDAKIGRLHHRLVAEGLAVGVLGAHFLTIEVAELPYPLRVVPLERGQPDAAQVLGVRVGVLRREPPETEASWRASAWGCWAGVSQRSMAGTEARTCGTWPRR